MDRVNFGFKFLRHVICVYHVNYVVSTSLNHATYGKNRHLKNLIDPNESESFDGSWLTFSNLNTEPLDLGCKCQISRDIFA